MSSPHTPEQSELNKKAAYETQYNPEKLFPIPRKLNRDKIGVTNPLPFFGCDIWNHYEVSWLNEQGKPIVAIAEIIYDCASENIIESKSMKLYFNSFNNTRIKNIETLTLIIQNDIASRIHSPVIVNFILLKDFQNQKLFSGFDAISIDNLPVACDQYTLQPDFLSVENEIAQETLCSDLLKSNCLVTNQPDWGSVMIDYRGKKINRENLLKYIVSFRNCNEFSETSIERIFTDIAKFCRPEFLLVYGRFTRRGGLDINVIRSTQPIPNKILNHRLCRQ